MPGVPVQLVTRRAIIARLCLIDGPLECPRGERRENLSHKRHRESKRWDEHHLL